MKDLQLLAQRAMDELDMIGVPYGTVTEFVINTRAKGRWGQCRRNNGAYTININVELLNDDLRDEAVLDTLIHELIHTCPKCMSHGSEWKKWAELVNDCYACYNIKRCTSATEKGIDPQEYREKRTSGYKWTFECPQCDKTWKYQRRPQWLNNGFDPCTKRVANANCPYCHKKIYMTAHGDLSNIPHVYQF